MNEFLSKLHKYKQALNLQSVMRTLIVILTCLIAGMHIYYLVWLNTPAQSDVLRYLNYFLKFILFVLFALLCYRGYRSFFNLPGIARWLDRQIDHEDDLYLNLYELKKQNENQAVLDALAGQALKRLDSSDYKVPGLFRSQQWFVLLFILIGIGSVWALSWDNLRYAARQFYTNSAKSIEYKKTIELSPGNTTLGKGSQLVVKVLEPDTRLEHRLFYKWDKQWRELGMTDNSYSFNALEYSIEYYVQNEVAKSAVYKVNCLDEPFVKRWEVHYKYPAHTGLGTSIDTLSYGNIEAFKHSEAILSISTNIPVKQAIMRFPDGKSQALQAVDASSFTVKLVITEAKSWYLELTDALGRKSRPEEKTITVIPDQVPEVRIVFPGEDVVLNQNLLLPLIISADDDFGLRNLTLHYQVNEQAPQSLILQALITSKLITLDHTFDLRDLGLMPGDNIIYWAEVFDNSPDRQSALSARYKARFPSIEEIYREIERQEKLKTEDLESALDESRDLQKDFEEKRRELMKEDTVKWEDKKQLEKILDKQEKLNEQVENVADDFQSLIEKMQLNEAVSAETLQKMQKIQELMQEISNDELRDKMSKFEQAMQNIDPDKLRKAMENFKFSMEDFSKKIDQTLQLLEDIKKEQAMEKALQIAQEMEKMESTLKDKTCDPSQNTDKLAQEQENISEKFENLKEELEKTDAMLNSPTDKQVKQELNELMQEMKKGDLKKDLEQSQQQLQQKQRPSAQQSQSEALDKMRRYTMKLGEMKESMGGGSQKEVMNAMQNAIRELLIFSKQHEELDNRLGTDPYQIIPDLIAHYEGIQVILNKMFSVPQVSMYLPPKFFMDLTDTNNSYREVFTNVNEMQYMQIPEKMDAIQRGLNLMIYDLMQTLNNPSSGSGSGSGMQSLMQMLGQMSQEQMAMNMLSSQLMMQTQQQGGQSNPAMQQQMQKLASDQERLAENLKRALQNNPEAQKQGNAIKQIINDAEAISRQLRSNQLSPDLLERQENILSRLLDAQRSINKREFSEKRKGETADQNAQQLDSPENYEALRRKAMLDDAYRSFPPAYQQVILKYLILLNE